MQLVFWNSGSIIEEGDSKLTLPVSKGRFSDHGLEYDELTESLANPIVASDRHTRFHCMLDRGKRSPGEPSQ